MHPNRREGADDLPHRGIPGLPSDLLKTYDGLVAAGATGPASARDLAFLAKALKSSKHHAEESLHKLEGKGLVGHTSSHHRMSWYARVA